MDRKWKYTMEFYSTAKKTEIIKVGVENVNGSGKYYIKQDSHYSER